MSGADEGRGVRPSVIYINHKPFYRLLLLNAFNVFRSRVAPHHLQIQSKRCHYIITFTCVTMPNCYLRKYTILAKQVFLKFHFLVGWELKVVTSCATILRP